MTMRFLAYRLQLAALLAALLLGAGAAAAQVSPPAFAPPVSDAACKSSSTTNCTLVIDQATGLCIRDASGNCQQNCTTTCNNNVQCEAPGVTQPLVDIMTADFHSDMFAAAATLENFLYDRIVEFLKSEFYQLEWLETKMIQWWQTMWSYNLLPGLQAMARQLNIELAIQTEQLQAQEDASRVMDTELALNRHSVEDAGIRPSGQVCTAGTMSGGFTRANAFEKAIRQAWEHESAGTGLNNLLSPTGDPVTGYPEQFKIYRANFCDPHGNSGKNICDPSVKPELANMDVRMTALLYNNLTIPADKDAAYGKATQSMINNLVGLPAEAPMLKQTLGSVAGRDAFLNRRSYIARHSAIRTIPSLIASWRMPGSGMGAWVKSLRGSTGIALNNISDNPSYKEIMHAMAIDRFNNGTYAASMLTDENKIEMEKLNLSVFNLMQLRDYYDLLERTALTLAVQVSVISENVKRVPAPPDAAPIIKGGP